jgi:phage replication-related protein YjqB (UPF0714/DUF867 family)
MFGNALGLQVTLIVILGLAQGLVHDVFAKDIYPSLAALQKSEKEGMDYRVRLEKRDSPFAVLAIHAGKIEVGTGELAQTVANDGYSLYLFEAIKPDEKTSWRLHVSSANFSEERAVQLAEGSEYCVSIHGFRGQDEERICMGGNNAKPRKYIEHSVKARIPSILIGECSSYKGETPTNIVNRCRQAGA